MEDISDHVIICGASTTARATAETFREEGVRSVILASDPADVEQFRTEGYVSQRGDSSSEDDLRAVGIGRARALVAADDSDAENLLTVITARGIDSQLRIVAVASAPNSLSKLRKAGANEAINAFAVAAKLVSTAALEEGGPAGSIPTPSPTGEGNAGDPPTGSFEGGDERRPRGGARGGRDRLTCTAVLAGGWATSIYRLRTLRISGRPRMSVTKMVSFTTDRKFVPAASRASPRFLKVCSA